MHWIIIIAAGRIVVVWVKNPVTRKVFQTIVILGFLGYYLGYEMKRKDRKKPDKPINFGNDEYTKII